MVWYWILGTLAAFGAFCALWSCFGFLLSGDKGCVMVCLCPPEDQALACVRRYHRLKAWGLFRGSLVLVDGGLGPREREKLADAAGCEICSLEEIPARLELERKRLG